jgi:glycerol-3-phosphate cytidylyltransferase-like family protein
VTVIARDETVKRIKGSAPDHHEDERLVALSELEIIDIAELGNSQDHYTCLREYTPQVICL